jgi:hypothetical protein
MYGVADGPVGKSADPKSTNQGEPLPMSLPRLRALGVLAATSAIAVAALGAPAGASAAIGTGKVDVAVDTGLALSLSNPNQAREVRDVDAAISTVGIGRLINQVKVGLVDNHPDLKGPCAPGLRVKFLDKAGNQYAGDDWISAGSPVCQKIWWPRSGLPLVIPVPTPFATLPVVIDATPSAYPNNVLQLPILAKAGKVCATVATWDGHGGLYEGTKAVCATIL